MSTDAGTAYQAPSNRLRVLAWLVLGSLTYWYASLAVAGAINARKLFPLFMALAMGSPALATGLVAALMPPATALGYIAVRYWVMPIRAPDWRNALALPLIVLVCMIVASVIAGFVASFIVVVAPFLPAPLYQLLLVAIVGVVAGICLFGIERLTTRVLFGRAEAARLRAALCTAHAAGLVAVLTAGSLPATLGVYLFHVAITQTWGKWLLLPISVCGWVAYLLLTWRAWSGGRPPEAFSARSVAWGLVLAFIVLSVIGAAARAAWGADPLQAMLWPLSYFVGWPKT